MHLFRTERTYNRPDKPSAIRSRIGVRLSRRGLGVVRDRGPEQSRADYEIAIRTLEQAHNT